MPPDSLADMIDGWRLQGHHDPITGRQAAEAIRRRASEGHLETWFEHDQGRCLAVITNGTRALVVVLDEPGDAGEHATDPTATGQQDGYVLSNGQHDTYDDRDTVPLEQALMIVEYVVDHGHPPAGVGWHLDR